MGVSTVKTTCRLWLIPLFYRDVFFGVLRAWLGRMDLL